MNLERNEWVSERYDLVMERIAQIKNEEAVPTQYREYFGETADFIMQMQQLLQQAQSGEIAQRSIEECERQNEALYAELHPENYAHSYANPAYAVEQLGEAYGRILSFLKAEIRAMIPYAFEQKKDQITILAELFVEIYNCFEDREIDENEVKQTIYWFFHDYSEWRTADAIHESIDPDYDFFTKIIEESDLSDPTYLYQYGSYIGKNERGISAFLNTLSESEIQAMADTFTEGYRIGFEVTNKDLSKKDTVMIYYPIGFERMVRAAIRNFEKMGLKPTIFREKISSYDSIYTRKNGCYGTSVNKQYDYDHQQDQAFYFDKAFAGRRLEVMRAAYESKRELAAAQAGPAVIEVFGEIPFAPVNKPQRATLDEKQQEAYVSYANEAGQITNEYIIGSERSFTIIAYPIPEIGEQFAEIFAETVKINTLDYKAYQKMQQALIDVLDDAAQVHVTGTNGNKTDLYVEIYPLTDRKTQTAFENCVADVNIPVGEVFTSPVLKGTNGTLQVSQVYLNDLRFENLEMEFADGMVTRYDCTNFETTQENQRYIKENVLMNHETLPMGEFAIGTNTTAYRMARVYDIADKLPILIAEKTGPHFAVGDTCYSHAEDIAVYNPDGKEIMPRDNEVSLQRKTDLAKAYLNCHTDITIPYDELGSITVIRTDGSRVDVIRDGRFVVPGTEELNVALDAIDS